MAETIVFETLFRVLLSCLALKMAVLKALVLANLFFALLKSKNEPKTKIFKQLF